MLFRCKGIGFGLFCLSALLAGCGGGGGGGTTSDDADSTTPTIPGESAPEKTLSISVSEILLSKLPDDQKYFVISETDVADMSGDTTLRSNKATEDSELVILSSEFGEPMALAIRHKGEEAVVVGLESSAVVFVLRNERFFGVEFDDLSAVEARIKAHPNFPDLVAELQSEVDDQSPCPMNPNCSFLATMTADEIAVTLNIDGLQYTADGGLN